MRVSVRSWRGEKQMTRQVPGWASATQQPVVEGVVAGVGPQGREVVGEDVGGGVLRGSARR